MGKRPIVSCGQARRKEEHPSHVFWLQMEDDRPGEQKAFCPGYSEKKVVYDREILVEILVYHYRTDNSGCGCGWAELGKSHPEHVADVYEASVIAKL